MFGEAGPRNERSRLSGFGQAENPRAIVTVNVGNFYAELRFSKIAPADDSLPGQLALIGLKIEEQISEALGELQGGVHAKAPVSKSDEAAGESCRGTLKVRQVNGIGFICGRQAPEILAQGQDARDNRDQVFALHGFRDHSLDAEFISFARLDVVKAGDKNHGGQIGVDCFASGVAKEVRSGKKERRGDRPALQRGWYTQGKPKKRHHASKA